jgi:hypothetical protein
MPDLAHLDPQLQAEIDQENSKVNGTDQVAQEDKSRARLFTPSELAELPPPKYLLKPFIREGGLNVIWGQPASGKSFIAIDWGLRIATGTPWFDGTRPEPGTVIYNPAEGAAGIPKRIEAWEKATGIKAPDRFLIWPEAVNYFRRETEAFEAALAQLPEPPKLVIVDTLARSMVGAEEDKSRDMGIFIEAAERVSNRYGAAILVVHHPDKGGNAERGSGSLRGAADVSVEARLDGSNLEIRSTKDKDAAAFETWRLSLQPHAESVVLSPKSGVGPVAGTEAEILGLVSSAFGTRWVTSAEIRAVSEIPKSSVFRALNGLVARGLMQADNGANKVKRFRIVQRAGESKAVSSGPVRPALSSPTVPSPLGLGPETKGGR